MTNFDFIDGLNPQGVPKLGIDILKKAELKGLSPVFFFKPHKAPTKINKKLSNNIKFIELLQDGCYSSKNFLFILQIHFVVQQTMEII